MSKDMVDGIGPLSGLRVIDLTRILAGPFCTMNLGDMGAEIIKVEEPKRGDDTRSWGPPFSGGEAAYFLGINRNKKSVALNLKDPRGQKILSDLLANADVLIENFKPGTLCEWGFTNDWFKTEAPHLIHCAITGYGDKGPKAGMPGYDFLLQAESGLMSITGESTGNAQKLGVAIVDVCTGQYAAMCILAAVNSRQVTGKGQRIDLSLYNTSLSILINVASNYLISGKSPTRYGNGHPNIVPYRDFRCKEGEIALAVGNDLQFRKFATFLGHSDWSDDSRFKNNSDRVNNREECEGAITKALSKKTAAEWLELFEKEGIPCGVINTINDALESEQARANNMVIEMNHIVAGEIKALGIPYQFSETPAEIKSAPPLLGEHTREILLGVLDFSETDIERLCSDGVVGL
ncbi:MAG: CoA transferase [Pseudomonadota bacterium]|nr:CoA transferase [Pseudomonadota bacterium]